MRRYEGGGDVMSCDVELELELELKLEFEINEFNSRDWI